MVNQCISGFVGVVNYTVGSIETLEHTFYAYTATLLGTGGGEMAYRFSEGQRVKVLEGAHLENGVEQYRGRAGTVDHIVESTPQLIFYSVAFGGSWDRGYIREEALEAVDEKGSG